MDAGLRYRFFLEREAFAKLSEFFVAAPAVATKVAAMSTSDPKPVLANSERFGE